MSTEIIKEGKMICEFMGYEYQCEEWCGWNIMELQEFIGENHMRSFKPYERWDDLMPIVEKIIASKPLLNEPPNTLGHNNINFKLEYDGYYRKWESIFYGEISYWDDKAIYHKIELPYKRYEGKTPIEAVWTAVTEFIKWYQNQILNNTINHGC